MITEGLIRQCLVQLGVVVTLDLSRPLGMIASGEFSSCPRIVANWADNMFFRPPHTACASPTLVHNAALPNSPSSSLALRPSPFGSHHPAVPVASSVTIARIASPHASDRSFQPLFLRALKSYFQGKKRLVKKGDVMAVPIWLEQAKLLIPKEGEVTEDPETDILDYECVNF